MRPSSDAKSASPPYRSICGSSKLEACAAGAGAEVDCGAGVSVGPTVTAAPMGTRVGVALGVGSTFAGVTSGVRSGVRVWLGSGAGIGVCDRAVGGLVTTAGVGSPSGDVGVGAAVGDGIGVADGTCVSVGVAVGAAVGAEVGVAVGAGVDVAVGAGVGVAVGTGVGVAVGTGVGVAVGTGVGVAVGTGVGVAVGTGVGVAVGAAVGDAVGLGVGTGAQVATVTWFVSKVTVAPRAKALPSMVVPAPTVIDVNARMFPCMIEFAPSVAELPTCQKMLQAWASFTRITRLPAAVPSVVTIWKMKTALGSLPPSSTTSPVMANVPAVEV